jgi:hypothetical protein
MGTMSYRQILIEHMALDISSQAVGLDDFRFHLFLTWFNARSSPLKNSTGSDGQTLQPVQIDIEVLREARLAESFKNDLKTWFETLPMPGLLWEYHLILDEITWWHDLDPRRLELLLRCEIGQ